jgi:hypothetical protein
VTVEEVTAPQREGIIALAPFLVEASFQVSMTGQQEFPHGTCTLIVCRDGRFIVNRKASDRSWESRAWDGNGLYYVNSLTEDADFLPITGFFTQFDQSVDPRIQRSVPMSDLLLAFTDQQKSDPTGSALPFGPLMALDYLTSADRYCASRTGRAYLRWVDVVDDRLAKLNTSMLSAKRAEPALVDLSVVPNPPVAFRAHTFAAATFEYALDPETQRYRVASAIHAGPWEAEVRGFSMTDKEFAESAQQQKTTYSFTYDKAIADGLLPQSVNITQSQPRSLDGSNPPPGLLVHWTITRFERMTAADADEALKQFALHQKHIVDVTQLPKWQRRYGPDANPSK